MAEKTFDLTNGFKNTKYSPKKDDIVDIDFSNHDVSYKEAGKNIVVTVTDKYTNVYTSTATKTSKDAATGTFYSYKSGKKTVYTKSATHDEASKLEKGTFYTYKNGEVDVFTKDATHDVANVAVESGYYKVNDDDSILYSATEQTGYTKIDADHKLYSYTSGSDTVYSLDETHEVDNELVPSDVKIYSYKSGNETIYSTSSVHSVANAEVKDITLYEKVTYDATWTAKGGESTEYEWKNAESAKTTEYVTKQGDDKFYYSDFKVTNDGSFNESTVKTNGKTDNYNVKSQEKDYTLTLVNAASKQNADSIKLTANGYNDFELLDANYTLEPGKKVNGTFLSETVTGTKANETFNLGTGSDAVNFKVETSTDATPVVTGFGHDTVKVSNGENLTLNLQGLATGESADTVAVTRNGDNLIVSATRGTETKTDLGQITIQGYANKGIGSVGLYNGSTDITSLITTAVTTQQDAAHKGNKFTGTVFADKAESTAKNETFNLGTTVGTGEDKVSFAGSFGKDTVNFVDGENLALDFANASNLKYSTKGNDVVISTDVSYYATVSINHDYIVDGNFRDSDGKMQHISIVNKLDSATYHKIGGAETETIDLAAYKRLSAKNKANYEFVEGKLRLDLAKKGDNYVFAKENLYTGVGEDGKPKAVYFYLDNNETASIQTSNYIWYDQEGEHVQLSGLKVYGVINGAEPTETTYTTDASGVYAKNAELFNNQISGQVTLKNYMKLAEDNVNIGTDSLKAILQGGADAQIALDYSSAKKGQTIKGTFLSENITGSKFADKIYAVGGTDTITAGKGNDTITLGTGIKTVNIAGGDGYDTIKGLSNATSLALNISGAVGSNNFVKSGNNLVIEHDIYSYKDGKEVKYSTSASRSVDNTAVESGYYKVNEDNSILYSKTEQTGYTKIDTDHKLYSYGSGKNITYYTSATHSENNTLVTEKTTVADYFIGNNADKVSTVALNSLNISGKGKIAGTKYNDVITGSAKADKITTGDGADVITAGKGNDTITIDGAGAKTLNFDRTSGKDTVVVSAADFTSANLVFDGTADYTYDHSVNGNDLIVKANYDAVKDAKGKVTQKASTATITVKDYFADGLASKVNLNGSAISYGTTLDGTEGKSRAEGEATKGNNIYDMTDSPATTSAAKTVKIFDESGNDLYNVASLKSNTYISDKAGKDALNINADADNGGYIFDVVADKSKTSGLYSDNSLFIFDYDNIVFKTGEGEKGLNAPVGGVEIANFINVASNGKYSVGAGAIETINVGDETWSGFSSKGLDKLRATVAGWLSENKYDSAYEVLNNGTKDDIQAMLALYNQNYTPDNNAEVTP